MLSPEVFEKHSDVVLRGVVQWGNIDGRQAVGQDDLVGLFQPFDSVKHYVFSGGIKFKQPKFCKITSLYFWTLMQLHRGYNYKHITSVVCD